MDNARIVCMRVFNVAIETTKRKVELRIPMIIETSMQDTNKIK